jgi:hypothetical protein
MTEEQKKTTPPTKWVSLDTMDGEGSLKQHCFKPRSAKMPWTGEPYDGNVSLCGNVHAASAYHEELQEDFIMLQGEPLDPKGCKMCLKIYQKLKS